jgi:1,4-dihydroxy-2-naphthoate polyprenyltransferase
MSELSVEKFLWIPSKLRSCLIATRPWSFPASLLSVFIPGIIIMLKGTGTMWSLNFFIGLFGTLAGHCLANILNTYYDFVNQVDKEDADDRGLLDKYIDLPTLEKSIVGLISFILLLFSAVIYNAPSNILWKEVCLFIPTIAITLLYTSKMISIKYFGKGYAELSIFMIFGPLLGQGVSVMLTGNFDYDVLIMSIPNGLLTANILHANNQRDLESDQASDIKTGAYYLGEDSYKAYKSVFLVSYLLPIFYSMVANQPWLNFYRIIPLLLNLPWTIYLCNCFSSKHYFELPQKTGQHNLLFGFILITSILPLEMFGRMLLGVLFYLGGVNNILVSQHAQALVHYKMKYVVPTITETMSGLLLWTAIVGQLISSVCFILGFYPVLFAYCMIAFLAPVTFIVHNFWVIEDPSPKKIDTSQEVATFPSNFDNEFVHFFKNIGMLGGCVIYLVYNQ